MGRRWRGRGLALVLVGWLVGPAVAEDDLTPLCDEFDNAETLGRWLRVFAIERTGADQLQLLDINTSSAGWLVMMPYTSVWYQDYRGVLVHQRVTGDFICTTRAFVTNRRGDGAPRSQFSLGGMLVRAPREVTPQTWRPGGENYVFLSLGAANQPGRYQWETKTTVNSNSQLATSPAGANWGDIRCARIGPHMVLLRREPEGRWQVHSRYHRPDFPAELQVGLTGYTDWPTCQRMAPAAHNTTVIRDGQPDLIAQFDFVHYRRPAVPPALARANLSDQRQVPDAALLSFLGEPADGPG